MMNTHFGKFVESPLFKKLFLVGFLLFTAIAAYQTNSAFCVLLGREHLYSSVYIIFVLVAVLILSQAKKRHPGRVYAKTVGFLSIGYLYYLLLLMVLDLLCLLIRPGESVKAAGTVMMLVTAVIIVLSGFVHAKRITTKKYSIKLGDSGEEFRLALVSDIHIGAFVRERHVGKVVKRINSLTPDLVVIAGDLFDVDNELLNDPEELKKISKRLRKIKSKYGTYAVMGNHDPKVDDKIMLRFLKMAHIKLLDDASVTFSQIHLIGRTDAGNNERLPLQEILENAASGKLMVVTDHNPAGIDEAAEHGADLVLCGHTHRGQFFPVNIFTKWANGKRYFYGHEQFGKTHAIISSGVGFFQLPVRIGTSNEVVDIRIQL